MKCFLVKFISSDSISFEMEGSYARKIIGKNFCHGKVAKDKSNGMIWVKISENGNIVFWMIQSERYRDGDESSVDFSQNNSTMESNSRPDVVFLRWCIFRASTGVLIATGLFLFRRDQV